MTPLTCPSPFQPCSLRNYVPRVEMNLKSFKIDVRDMTFRKPKKKRLFKIYFRDMTFRKPIKSFKILKGYLSVLLQIEEMVLKIITDFITIKKKHSKVSNQFIITIKAVFNKIRLWLSHIIVCKKKIK